MLSTSKKIKTLTEFISLVESISSDWGYISSTTHPWLEAANKARERTVFVVNAASITEFLKGWKVRPKDGYQFAVDRLIG
jgi:hypothetical protein